MELSGGHEQMQEFLKREFKEECPALVELIKATPPHQIQRRRIEVNEKNNLLYAGTTPSVP